MADVTSTLASWSSTSASNAPSGATTIGTGLAPNLREIQGVMVRGLSHKGADIASAATTDIGAVEGLMHDITGTTNITAFGTVRAGIWKVLKFEGALTLTHNGTSLILPGAANITTADGDVGIFISEGSGNWRCLHYMKASGYPVRQLTSVAKQATTSGLAINFTGIPSWARRITVMFQGVSLNGTSDILVQLGISSGVETSGYISSNVINTGTVSNSTAGFLATGVAAAAGIASGIMTICLHDSASNTWIASGALKTSTGSFSTNAGEKALAGTLDRVQITTVNGTDAFDAGSVSLMYE